MSIGMADAAETEMAYDLMPGVSSNSFKDDNKLNVRFFKGNSLNIAESKKQKRHVYDEVTFVRVQVPGDSKNILHEPLLTEEEVTQSPRHQKNYAARFPVQYKAFLAGADQASAGTPLLAWPMIRKNQVAELKHFGVETVEQLAGIPDSLAQRGMNWSTLKKSAVDWLEQTKDTAYLATMREELGKTREQNETDMAAMKAQLAELTSMLAGKADAKKAVVK